MKTPLDDLRKRLKVAFLSQDIVAINELLIKNQFLLCCDIRSLYREDDI